MSDPITGILLKEAAALHALDTTVSRLHPDRPDSSTMKRPRSPKTEHARRLGLGALGGLLLMASGCKVTVLEPTSEDTVRERLASIEKRNKALELENSGLKGRLAEAEAALTREQRELAEATPRLSAISITSSSLIKVAPDGTQTLTLRLDPSDDRGRFMQVVGSLSVRVVAVPTDGAPTPLAVARFDPAQVREAWRGGVMGSGYVFEIPLTGWSSGRLPETVDVVVNFTDAPSGQELRDERPVRVSQAGV